MQQRKDSHSSPITNPREGAVCLVRADSLLLVAGDSTAAAWLGVEPADFSDRRLGDLLPDLDAACLAEAADHTEPIATEAHLAIGKPEPLPVEAHVRRLSGVEGDRYLVSINTPSSRAVVYRDALTGLPDRRELEPHRVRWRHNAASQMVPHALLFMDVNQFKKVNDTHGHALGDRVLVELTKRWERCVREDDLIARYGGDEFVVLLAGVGTREAVEPITKRLAVATCEPIAIDDILVTVAVTIGVALADDVAADLDELLAAADRDMYAAKRWL